MQCNGSVDAEAEAELGARPRPLGLWFKCVDV